MIRAMEPTLSNFSWTPPRGAVARGSVCPGGSKAIVQRAMVLAALARGTTRLVGVERCQDVEVFARALKSLGFAVEFGSSSQVIIEGCGGELPGGDRSITLGNNGSALRFLMALAALRGGRTTFEAASHRPTAPLAAALVDLGATVEFQGSRGYPPLVVEGGRLRGGRVTMRLESSSQFASALLMIAPLIDEGIHLRLVGPVLSRPYIDLTVAMISAFGGEGRIADREWQVKGGSALSGGVLSIDPDASTAAMYFAAAAITGGEVTVKGMPEKSHQGDTIFPSLLEKMGCVVQVSGSDITVVGGELKGINITLVDYPDLVPPLVAVAAFARGETVIAGVGHLRHKECDRLEVLAGGLARIGIGVSVEGEMIRVTGTDPIDMVGATLDPKNDHRMAMAFALLALRAPSVVVENCQCVEKSAPEFFAHLGSLLEANR